MCKSKYKNCVWGMEFKEGNFYIFLMRNLLISFSSYGNFSDIVSLPPIFLSVLLCSCCEHMIGVPAVGQQGDWRRKVSLDSVTGIQG